MGIAVWRFTEEPIKNIAMGSICEVMDKAQNRGKLSEMGPEWSPGPENRGLSIQPCLEIVCAQSWGQEGPPMASFDRKSPSGRGRQNQLLRCSIGAPRFGVGGMAQPLNNLERSCSHESPAICQGPISIDLVERYGGVYFVCVSDLGH